MGENRNFNFNCNNQISTEGRYYTIDNVENSLPKIPVKQQPKPERRVPIEKNSELKFQNPSPFHKGAIIQNQNERHSRFYKKVATTPPKNSVEDITPWYLKPITSSTLDRANGRPAKVIKLGLRDQGGKRTETHIIFLVYQMVTGAIGGILLGIETGYLTMDRNRQAPSPSGGNEMLGLGKVAENPTPKPSTFIRRGIIFWRTSKRTMAAALLFNFIEKNIEESRKKSDWKNSAYTGAICGGLYGIPGGMPCAVLGSGIFAAFAGLSGFYDQLKRKDIKAK